MKLQSSGPDWSLTSDLEFVTDALGEVWAELKHARLFMTGGTGFIGCWLLEALRHADRKLGLGLRVTVLTRDPAAFHRKAPHLASYESFRFVAGDVTNFAIPDQSFSHLIHAATDASAELNEKKVRACFFRSSGAVYGRQPWEMERVAEDWIGAPDCTDPKNAYAEGKRA